MSSYKPSLVEYPGGDLRQSCGYCHSEGTFHSNEMWAHTMTVEDYQDLIDRGWRRSGHYCYKPIMNSTCCPTYTIRCAAQDFKVSKSQKKISKRVNKFLAFGIEQKDVKPSLLKKTEMTHSLDIPEPSIHMQKKKINLPLETSDKMAVDDKVDSQPLPQKIIKTDNVEKPATADEAQVSKPDQAKLGKTQMKAKYLRIERKKQKLRNMGLSDAEIEKRMLEKKKSRCKVKTLEDYLNEPQPENPAHKLEIKLVKSYPSGPGYEETFRVFKRYQVHVHSSLPDDICHRKFKKFLVTSPLEIRLFVVKSPEFETTLPESASLFAKYQKAVHKDSDDGCNYCVFHSFLVDSPLEPKKCYGSYHQQYWLDGKLIAVGVIDILPKCLSSVYFLYDPDYIWLNLGTYGALREIEFVRKLASQYPEIKYYYMGYYIHSCVKMRYKAAFKPSYLLCPEVYTWHIIQNCLPKLDVTKYSRLNEDLLAKDNNGKISHSDVTVLYNGTVMSLSSYMKMKKCGARELEDIMKYVTLVGVCCAKRILLYRP